MRNAPASSPTKGLLGPGHVANLTAPRRVLPLACGTPPCTASGVSHFTRILACIVCVGAHAACASVSLGIVLGRGHPPYVPLWAHTGCTAGVAPTAAGAPCGGAWDRHPLVGGCVVEVHRAGDVHQRTRRAATHEEGGCGAYAASPVVTSLGCPSHTCLVHEDKPACGERVPPNLLQMPASEGPPQRRWGP